ncbi:hypothetical protein RND71_042503 [Anisodus tanguticus]|uniref:Aminotransferase class I/classII large domain-containing protein n=1 Tax=Anisodus tanguticus TaxID=243964 RepID=A0AAE1QQU0_9SOLA|nr:hypothetical protein RND71_042503 [Anisodus tanguticus]
MCFFFSFVRRCQEGKPLVLNVVRQAEQLLVNDRSRVKEYLSITGLADFNKLSAKLIFGADSPAIQENRVTTVQCLSAMLEDLGSAPSGAIVLLHACEYNPTGVDPTIDQWEQIRRLMRLKGLLPFFDSAYQGFASESLDTNAQSVRMVGEVCRNADVASRVESQLN